MMKQQFLFLVGLLFTITVTMATDLQPTRGITVDFYQKEKSYQINITKLPHLVGPWYYQHYEDLIAPEIVLRRGQKRNLRVSVFCPFKDLAFSASNKLPKDSNNLSILSLTKFSVIKLRGEAKEPIIDLGELGSNDEIDYCKEWTGVTIGEVVLKFSLMIEDSRYAGIYFPVTLKVPIKVIEKEGEHQEENENQEDSQDATSRLPAS